MIGVISKPEECPVVEEFFELFKTPWEFYRTGRSYDVVISTVDDVPELDAKLLILYGSTARRSDGNAGIAARGSFRNAQLDYQALKLPIYGQVLTFTDTGTPVLSVHPNLGIAGF